MTCVHSTLSSSPARIIFGGLSALSFKNAYSAATAGDKETLFQRGVSRLLGRSNSQMSQTARKLTEVGFWLANGSLCAIMALMETRCTPQNDCVREPIWANRDVQEASGLTSWLTAPLNIIDDYLLFGLGKATLQKAVQYPITSLATTLGLTYGINQFYQARHRQLNAPPLAGGVVGLGGAQPVIQAAAPAQPQPQPDNAALLAQYPFLNDLSEARRNAWLARPAALAHYYGQAAQNTLWSFVTSRRLWTGLGPDILDWLGVVDLDTSLTALGWPKERNI